MAAADNRPSHPFAFGSTVMILGVFVLRKKYPLAKYLCVLLIVSGVALFLYKPNKSVTSTESAFGFGEILLVSVTVLICLWYYLCDLVCVSLCLYMHLLSVPLWVCKCDLLSPCIVAAISDHGRVDWCGPGPHEESLPDQCQSHDAQHQHVVHPGAGTR